MTGGFMKADNAHMATTSVVATAEQVFDYLCDPIKLGRWSLGCFDTVATDTPGIYAGRSLYDGGQGWFKIVNDRQSLWIEYHVGTPDNLVARIAAKVIPGPVLGHDATISVFSLMAWRTTAMDEARWARLCAAHEAEIDLIKAQIESLYT